MMPRMMAGMFAPLTPKTERMVTGNGTPVRWLGLATRLTSACTMTMPTMSARNTCQLAIPSANRLPAVTYPPTECTSDIQNAKMLYQDQVCFLSGVRSLLARRGWYPSLMMVSESFDASLSERPWIGVRRVPELVVKPLSIIAVVIVGLLAV